MRHDDGLKVGERVVAESTHRRPRPGVIEEVLRGDPSPRIPSGGTTAPKPPVEPLG